MSGTTIPDAFLEAIPKTDLHVHLDGSVRVDTICDLAASAGIELAADTPEGLRDKIFKDSFASLEEYLETFDTTNRVTQTPENLRRIAYEFAQDNFNEGVRYFEVRFAPQLHANADGFSIEDVLVAVNEGLAKATAERNAADARVAAGDIAPFEYGIISCALRAVFPGLSTYYDAFTAIHKHESPERVLGLLSMAAVTASLHARDKLGVPVVALDIAGAEAGFRAKPHRDAFHHAKKNWLNKTVHAGEGYGPESIFQAITDLHAERIGHGYHLFSTDKVLSPHIEDKDAYVRGLVQHIADRRITLEVCPTSNEHTMPELLGSLHKHALGKMLAHDVSVTICTDNRTVSRTTVTNELRRVVDTFDVGPAALKEIVVTGFKRSFFPRTYDAKREYLRTIIAEYDRLAEEHGVVE